MRHMKSMNGKNIKCLEDKSLGMYFIEIYCWDRAKIKTGQKMQMLSRDLI